MDALVSASLAYIAVNNKSCLKQGGSQEPTLRLSPDLHICTMASEHPGISVPTLTTPTPAHVYKICVLGCHKPISNPCTSRLQDIQRNTGFQPKRLSNGNTSVYHVYHPWGCMLPGLDREHFLSFLKIRKQKCREGNSLTYACWSNSRIQVQGLKETSLWTLGKTGSLTVYIWEHQQGFRVGQEGVC